MTRSDRFARVGLGVVLLAALACAGGCGSGPETGYGRSTGTSLNGTGAFAEMLRRAGHEVRVARRLTEELGDWADVIVRFATRPGPLEGEEASWYDRWMEATSEAALVYVVRDYDAEPEYWELVLARLDPDSEADRGRREQARANLDRAKRWADRLPARAKEPADGEAWFTVGPANDPARACRKLEGPWGDGLDATIPVHEPLEPGEADVLLRADGQAVAIEWSPDGDARVLVVANGSFLLNLPMAIPARRPLAGRVVDWIGPGPRRVAFVEGSAVLGESETPPSLFDLLRRISSFRWVALHFAAFGLLACLARAPRLGRPRVAFDAEPMRPAAHAEALGGLLEKARAADRARELLETYRRWRFPRTTQEPRRAAGPGPG